jgi:hypothetical protein
MHFLRFLLPTFLLGCGAALPAPSTAYHPAKAFLPVPYPPPAALAETVPPRPERDSLVWLDGEWVYHGKAYTWRRGGWVVAPTDARYARWATHYRKDGRLELANGTWYDAQLQPLPFVEPIRSASTPANELTSELDVAR